MMTICNEPAPARWERLCKRVERREESIRRTVAAILRRVRKGGDAALRDIAQEIEGYRPEALEVSAGQRRAAAAEVPAELKAALATARANIEAFHRAQLPAEVCTENMPGVRCIQRAVPIERVGLYVPGGKAPLVSTVLMLAVPAAVAGCPEVILCTPAGKDGSIRPEILYAAELCGVNRIFALGGAQAVAAMAYGTETVPRVDKIFGPGNRYVTMAKQLVGGQTVSIDMPAGPSEVLVLADESARADFAAADLLSQAEHGGDSQSILVCHSRAFARAVCTEVEQQLAERGRQDIIREALANCRIIVLGRREDRIAFANAYAAEHLIIMMKDPWEAAGQVRAAGSIFIGERTPESAGDYASGTNHTLPTGGWARSCSGVNTDAFMRKITYQEISREGLAALAPAILAMAKAEGLDAHAAAVEVRL